MLTIRFSRKGKKKKPFYRLIISEKTKDTQSSYLELLGSYDPTTKKAVLKSERISYWISKGAQTSASVFNLLIKEGVIKSDKKARSVSISKKRLVKQEAAEKSKQAEADKKAEAKKQLK